MPELDDLGLFPLGLVLLPGDAEILNNLGLALVADGRVAEGIARYREALGQKPYLAEIHNNLGIALAAQNAEGEAVANWQTAADAATASFLITWGTVLAMALLVWAMVVIHRYQVQRRASEAAQSYRALARELVAKPASAEPLPTVEDVPAIAVPPPEAFTLPNCPQYIAPFCRPW